MHDSIGAEAPRIHRRAEKISEIVAREIVHDIVSNNLQPGARLPSEANMVRSYNVGRASLREALRILEVQGLIQIRPGPGGGPVVNSVDASHFGRWATFYFHLSRATFLELLEARIVIEPVMAGLAATRRDSAMLAELEAIAARTHVVAVKDDEDYRSVARDFHALITGMSGNRVLDLFGRAIQTIYTGRVQSHALRPKARQQVLDDHDAITAAITAGDADKAQLLMRDHMIELKRQVERANPGALRDIVDWL